MEIQKNVHPQQIIEKKVEKVEAKNEIKEDFTVTGNSDFKKSEIKQNHNFFN
jgi:hypothetical protein